MTNLLTSLNWGKHAQLSEILLCLNERINIKNSVTVKLDHNAMSKVQTSQSTLKPHDGVIVNLIK